MNLSNLVGFTAVCLLGAHSLHSAQVLRGPYLQSAGADRMTVCWRTDVPTTTELSFGLATSSLGTPVIDPGTRTDHAVTLTGLQPSTRYYYRVHGSPASGGAVDVSGPEYRFNTSPTPGSHGPARFWVVGDSGYLFAGPNNSFASYMNQTSAAGKRTDAFFMLGDNAYPNGSDAEYQYPVFYRYATLLRNAPLWSAFGNHDSYTSILPNFVGPVPYDSIFHFPTNGDCGGLASGSERYYSFDHGNIHFVCLDTYSHDIASDVPGAPYGMVDWLKDDLKSCTSDWIIAFMHMGPYTKGSHDSDVESEEIRTRSHVVPLLEAYGADLVLCGHSHVYERSGLTDGHYGNSSTWNTATMRKSSGNGSDLGGVDSGGNFVTGPAAAGGVYQKPAATGRAGAVYAVVGGSSAVQTWSGGSTALVNPNPHPAHLVSILALGSMVVEVEDHRLNARYLGEFGAVRDDFTILKGATYTLHPPSPTMEAGNLGVAFPVTRTGSTAFAEQVPVSTGLVTGPGQPPAQGMASFAAGQSGTFVTFFPQPGSASIRFEASLQHSTRAIPPDGAPRSAYRIEGAARQAQFAATPSATWYASRFNGNPSSPSAWDDDTDLDGLPLLLEYALGGEPDRNDAGLLPKVTTEGNTLVFRYTRPSGRNDLAFQVVSSIELSNWSTLVLNDTADGPATVFGEPRKIEVPIDSERKFLRLKVTLSP